MNADTKKSTGSDSRAVDSVFDVLSHRYRRYVLYRLQDGAGSAAIGDLVEYVLARNGPEARDERDVRSELRSVHLPRLTEEGFVDVDDGAGVVRLAGPTPQLLMHLEMAKREELPPN